MSKQMMENPKNMSEVQKASRDTHLTESYTFEMSEEVRAKIQNADNKHSLIDVEALSDLKPLGAPGRGYRFVKRTMDIVVSFFALLVLSLPMVIISAIVFVDDPGRVLFRQYRVGRDGKRFKLYKFRTMKKETPKYLSTMEVGDPTQYVTRLGRFLRKYSLDEIPQLFNILKGDMSMVGPRPLISDEYEIHQMRTALGVYSIRPGVTGLAQINGRDTVSPQDKVRWDYKYLETIGLKTDMKILIATVPRVLGHVGVVEGYSIYSNQPKSEQSEKEEENVRS